MRPDKGAQHEAGRPSLNRVATVPNAISLGRVLLIPVYTALLLRAQTERAGLVLLGVVAFSDWVDGFVARRTNQVSRVGQVLDPVADRLALAAAAAVLVARRAVPLWAALLIVTRDALVLAVAAALILKSKVRIEVRWIGKAGTLALMCALPLLAWGHFGLPAGKVARAAGWALFWPGVAAYLLASLVYAFDVLAVVRGTGRSSADARPVSGHPGEPG